MKKREELNQEAIRMAKQINQRFYRMEKKQKGLGESAYYYAKFETGKQKPRYTTSYSKISGMTDDELKEFMLGIGVKIKSPSSTLRGIKQLKENRLNAAVESLIAKVDFSQDGQVDRKGTVVGSADDFRKFIEEGGGYLLNKFFDSEQLIEDWIEKRKKGITNKQFINTYNYYLDRKRKPYDQKEVETKFNKIIMDKALPKNLKKAKKTIKKVAKTVKKMAKAVKK